MSSLLPFIRLQRLRQTWEYTRARNAHYAVALPDLRPDSIYPGDLQAVPVLTAAEYAADPWRFRTLSSPPLALGTSGGSTGRAKLVPYAPASPEVRVEGPDVRPLILRATGGAQGSLVGGTPGVMAIPFQTAHNYALAWDLLTRHFDFPGFSTRIVELGVPLPALKQLVHFALDRELPTSNLALRGIATYAWHLSPAWSARIEDVLGVAPEAWYGFSESAGIAARRCWACGHFHYQDHAWWEVVSPDDHRPVTDGQGLLLVTTLVPYVRDVVLFRYAPGDLVEIGPHCPQHGEPGFRVLGRQERCARVNLAGKSRCILAPTDVLDYLDTQPWVARIANVRHSGVTPSQDDAFPKWRWDLADAESGPRLVVQVEVKGNPRFFRAEWAALASGLEHHLIAANPALAELVGRGALRLEIEGRASGEMVDREVIIA